MIDGLEKKASLIHEGERVDDLQRNGYGIIQDPGRFCFGMDAVLLSGFARIRTGDRVCDLGTGTGIIPILLEAKTKASHLTGLELLPESADMARRSVEYNGLSEKIDIVEGDLCRASEIFGRGSFDAVTSNPPYMIEGHGLQNDGDPLTVARHEVTMTLRDLIRETAALLVPGGRCFFVHRPFRLIDIVALMREYDVEPKRMQLVYPFIDKEPNMVLIEGIRGGKPRLSVEKPLIIYKEQGVYTDEIYEIYGY